MKKERNNILIFFLIFFIITTLLLAGYIYYDKNLKSVKSEDIKETYNNKKDESKKEETNNEEINNQEEKTKTCYGTYYGEAKGTYPNGLSYDYKYTYNLKEDGTFTANFGGVTETSGVYVINDNTVSFISLKNIAGPKDEDPQYSTSDYLISDDCSYIKINLDNETLQLNKK